MPTIISQLLLITIGSSFIVPGISSIEDLDAEPIISLAQRTDWLIDPSPYVAGVYRGDNEQELILSNGLVRRTFRIFPNLATVALDHLITGESVLRSVRPEARITIDGVTWNIGGLLGQPNHAFLRPEWVEKMTTDPAAFQLTGWEVGPIEERMAWKRVRHHAPDATWPPAGVAVRFDLQGPPPAALGSKRNLPSSEGRKALIIDQFKILDPAWRLHLSSRDPDASFHNEGKPGEIRSHENLVVSAERDLPKEVGLVELTLDVGTDRSKSWGPGISLIWPDRVIQYSLRPGEGGFGRWDGEETVRTGPLGFDLSQPITIRMAIEKNVIHLAWKQKNTQWNMGGKISIPAEAGPPLRVRIGKSGIDGSQRDFSGTEGDEVRLRLIRFAAYSAFDPSRMKQPRLDTAEPLKVSVHYELYDGLPCFSKWIEIENTTSQKIVIDEFTSEILAAVEHTSRVEERGTHFPPPNILVETDYAFSGMDPETVSRFSVHWVEDPLYSSQVNYLRATPCLLEVRPTIGPAQDLLSGERFRSFRAFILPYDGTDRERKGLAHRRMYRTIAPWTTENPLMMHARYADWDRVKLAIDQCAEVGFEMVIMTFGSGFQIENDTPEYLDKMKGYADYARKKGVEIGGYSLLSSRSVGGGNDIVSPAGTSPTHGSCPALASDWGQEYFRKLYQFFDQTGMRLLEHDGSYPGDVDVTERLPLQKGAKDSRWVQWKIITDFYKWCRAKGVYLNVPDYYYLAGSNKCGMGYREVNWSLPRAQQVIHSRQNIFDGTWTKSGSMGWMFVPLTQYHGGGAAATIEPLSEHLNHYQRMMMSTLGAGVQACYRGPRLFDSDETRSMVKESVDWFKKHRTVLEGDLIHLRRADARDLDYWLMVAPQGQEKGLLMLFNPLDQSITRTIRIPLYYTGLVDQTLVRIEDGTADERSIRKDGSIDLEVTIDAGGFSWITFE
ncbi:MAG: hypothetical protein OSB09_02415 [Planctomycetota bacterium]|nr:hypothetical protein [Planctomycetota bacterium]